MHHRCGRAGGRSDLTPPPPRRPRRHPPRGAGAPPARPMETAARPIPTAATACPGAACRAGAWASAVGDRPVLPRPAGGAAWACCAAAAAGHLPAVAARAPRGLRTRQRPPGPPTADAASASPEPPPARRRPRGSIANALLPYGLLLCSLTRGLPAVAARRHTTATRAIAAPRLHSRLLPRSNSFPRGANWRGVDRQAGIRFPRPTKRHRITLNRRSWPLARVRYRAPAPWFTPVGVCIGEWGTVSAWLRCAGYRAVAE